MQELWFLNSARCLMLINISEEKSFKGENRWTDGQKDGLTDKQWMTDRE